MITGAVLTLIAVAGYALLVPMDQAVLHFGPCTSTPGYVVMNIRFSNSTVEMDYGFTQQLPGTDDITKVGFQDDDDGGPATTTTTTIIRAVPMHVYIHVADQPTWTDLSPTRKVSCERHVPNGAWVVSFPLVNSSSSKSDRSIIIPVTVIDPLE
jgi:hypothetical protein